MSVRDFIAEVIIRGSPFPHTSMSSTRSSPISTRRSSTSFILVAMAILATVSFGYWSRRKAAFSEVIGTTIPRKVTKATAKMAGFGTDTSLIPTSDLYMNKAEPKRNQKMVAAWIRLDIPHDNHNFPQPTFQLTDESTRRDFPFQVVWKANCAYLLIPKGYEVSPSKLTLTVQQGDRVIDTEAVPSLPPPAKVATPKVEPVWPEFEVHACHEPGSTVKDPLISFKVRSEPQNHILVELVGSSGNEIEPANSRQYEIYFPKRKLVGPMVSQFPIYYPGQTHTLFLKLSEIKETIRKFPQTSDEVVKNAFRSETIKKTIRSEIIAVPLDNPSELVAGQFTRIDHSDTPPGRQGALGMPIRGFGMRPVGR